MTLNPSINGNNFKAKHNRWFGFGESENAMAADVRKKARNALIACIGTAAISLGAISTLDVVPAVAQAFTQEREPEMKKTSEFQQVKGLLDVIARGESSGNYNAYYGNPGNDSIIFTSMTVSEVMNWQRQAPNSAVGKYQIIDTTLPGLVDELDIPDDRVFDEKLQDEFAIALLRRRGIQDYMEGRINREQFGHNLSQEWAALPQILGDHGGPDPNASYYAKDGTNKATITVIEFMDAIDSVTTVQEQQAA